MLGLFINVDFILGSIENSILPETTVEDDAQISTSVERVMIQSCLQDSQNVSEDLIQVQLLQGSHASQTKTEEKGDLDTFELKVAEKNKLIDAENLPHNRIVQKLKVLEGQTSGDNKESTQKEEAAMNNIALVGRHSLHVEKTAPAHGPVEDAEDLDLFNRPLLSSICTDDLPDLEDAESTVAFPTKQSSKQNILMYPEDEETY